MVVRISIEENRCIGAGQCVLTAPEVFDQNDDGYVEVLDAQPDAAVVAVARLQTVSRICPSQAITVHED